MLKFSGRIAVLMMLCGTLVRCATEAMRNILPTDMLGKKNAIVVGCRRDSLKGGNMPLVIATFFLGAIATATAGSAAETQLSFPPQCRGFLRSGEIRLTHVWGSYAFAHAGPIVAAAFSPDGRRLFTAGWIPWVRAWDAATGEEVWTVPERYGAGALAATPDGRLLVGVTGTGQLTVWSAGSGRREWSAPAQSNGDPTLAVSADGRMAVSADSSGHIVLWDLERKRAVRTIEAGYAVNRVAFSPNGRFVAAIEPGSGRQTFWVAGSGKPPTDEESVAAQPWLDTLYDTRGVIISPDGSVSLGGSGERIALVPQREGGRKVGPTPGHGGGVAAVAVSPDGARLLSAGGDGSVVIRDVATGVERRGPLSDEQANPMAAAFDPRDGTAVIGWAGETVYLQRIAPSTGKSVGGEELGGVHGRLQSLSPSLKLMALAPFEQPPRILDRQTGKALWVGAKDDRILAITDAGAALVLRGRAVQVLDARRGRAAAAIPAPSGATAGTFSPDGRLVLLAGHDGTIQLRDVQSQREVGRVDLGSSTDYATALAFGSGGRSFVAGTARGVVLRFELTGAAR